MTEFDFTSILERRGHDAIAVEGLGRPGAPGAPKAGFDPIPMWVADMNFPTVPAIPEAIRERAAHPAYGYFSILPGYYEAIRRWQQTRNGAGELPDAAIGYENGVLGGVVSALRALVPQGGPVLVHSPTYIGFTAVLRRAGFEIVHSPLQVDSLGVWRMDYADMERQLSEKPIHAAILCSPHNPCGRVWERAELEEAMALFRKYDVTVISDEIWSDLTLDGHRHLPTQLVSDDARLRTVALYAPSKTFNLAGLVGSYPIIYDRRLRDLVEAQSAMTHYNDMNVLSMHALMAGYSDQGARWVDALRRVLSANVHTALDFFRAVPGIWAAQPQATYMLYLDCTEWCRANGVTIDELQTRGTDVGVAWQDGRPFGGPCHIRMNLALPASRVREALDRLARYVFRTPQAGTGGSGA